MAKTKDVSKEPLLQAKKKHLVKRSIQKLPFESRCIECWCYARYHVLSFLNVRTLATRHC